MKVCHLTSVHPAEDIRILIKECQTLAKAGHDVSLVVANTDSRSLYGVNVVGVESIVNNPIQRIFKSPKRVFETALKIDADVYHFHDPELIPVGLKLSKKGKHVIYDVHEDVPEQVLSKQWIPKPLRKLISTTVEKVERYASKRFSAVVTATPTISKRFKTYNSNTVTVHNYPILNELIGQASENSNVEKQGNKVIYIGGITELRGIKEMVAAMEKVNSSTEAELALAGKFAPEQLKTELETTTGWNYVNHLGYLNRDQVKSSLSESDIGLVLIHPEPRYVVSLPIKMFEYMSAGIPVIASNFPLWKEIVEGDECGICVDPLNLEEIADAIKWLINNPEAAGEMGRNGRKAIEEKYNWEKESETLINLYNNLD
ncbi:glycosyltransferase family 4 protein [Pseudalkalibacillus caeni]|uniref:Glycosyltransferase family 4 protein n=1 Tax=Exobacillus caeni TaxID=2574798 RepID=A0A5R9F844_9BACL|nr:glycosyltransferase family 4 protein [Pseudalkalibacillus caeni]TLS38496.1 glycosyltransferase family 4 protein [Pseudalkalibacillus caeni]